MKEAEQTDDSSATAFKLHCDACICTLEKEMTFLIGKQHKKRRAATAKKIANIRNDPMYIDALKVVRGLSPPHSSFFNAGHSESLQQAEDTLQLLGLRKVHVVVRDLAGEVVFGPAGLVSPLCVSDLCGHMSLDPVGVTTGDVRFIGGGNMFRLESNLEGGTEVDPILLTLVKQTLSWNKLFSSSCMQALAKHNMFVSAPLGFGDRCLFSVGQTQRQIRYEDERGTVWQDIPRVAGDRFFVDSEDDSDFEGRSTTVLQDFCVLPDARIFARRYTSSVWQIAEGLCETGVCSSVGSLGCLRVTWTAFAERVISTEKPRGEWVASQQLTRCDELVGARCGALDLSTWAIRMSSIRASHGKHGGPSTTRVSCKLVPGLCTKRLQELGMNPDGLAYWQWRGPGCA